MEKQAQSSCQSGEYVSHCSQVKQLAQDRHIRESCESILSRRAGKKEELTYFVIVMVVVRYGRHPPRMSSKVDTM